MALLCPLAVSLVLTLLLELAFALLWGVERQDMLLVVLVNVLTNPVVVLGWHMAYRLWPGALTAVTALLELGAVAVEGRLYQSRSRVRLPWLFALCANLFSYHVGLLL